jgi:hypothetical protein
MRLCAIARIKSAESTCFMEKSPVIGLPHPISVRMEGPESKMYWPPRWLRGMFGSPWKMIPGCQDIEFSIMTVTYYSIL